MTDAVAPMSAAVTPSPMGRSPAELDEPEPPVLFDRAPHGAQRIRKVPLQARGRHGKPRSSENLTRALLPLRAWEAEEHGLGRIRSGGDEQVALELFREAIAGLRPAIELEGKGQRAFRCIQSAEPVGAHQPLPPEGALALPPPPSEAVRMLARAAGMNEPGEEPICLPEVSEPGAVQHPERTVESEPELVRLDPPALGHDKCSGLVEDVVPGQRPGLSLGSCPPQESQPVKLKQSLSRSWVAREVELVQLDGREDPVLEQVGADPLIPFGERSGDGLESQAIGARASPRTIASLGHH